MESTDDEVGNLIATVKKYVDDSGKFNGCVVYRVKAGGEVQTILVDDSVNNAVRNCWGGGTKARLNEDDLILQSAEYTDYLYGIKRNSDIDEVDNLVSQYREATRQISRDNSFRRKAKSLRERLVVILSISESFSTESFNQKGKKQENPPCQYRRVFSYNCGRIKSWIGTHLGNL